MLTVRDLSLKLNVSQSFIRKLIRKNDIPFTKISENCIRFDEAEIDSWLLCHKKGACYDE